MKTRDECSENRKAPQDLAGAKTKTASRREIIANLARAAAVPLVIASFVATDSTDAFASP